MRRLKRLGVVARCLAAVKECGVDPALFVSMRALAGLIGAGRMMPLTEAAEGGLARMGIMAHGKPLELAALIAAILAIPASMAAKKQYLNSVKRDKKPAGSINIIPKIPHIVVNVRSNHNDGAKS